MRGLGEYGIINLMSKHFFKTVAIFLVIIILGLVSVYFLNSKEDGIETANTVESTDE